MRIAVFTFAVMGRLYHIQPLTTIMSNPSPPVEASPKVGHTGCDSPLPVRYPTTTAPKRHVAAQAPHLTHFAASMT